MTKTITTLSDTPTTKRGWYGTLYGMIGAGRGIRREAELMYGHLTFPAEEDMTFEVVEFIELAFQPGRSMPPPSENIVGEFDVEDDAVEAARTARESFIRENGVRRDAWWLVRQPGSQLASWIADAASDREFVLDLRTGQLVEI